MKYTGNDNYGRPKSLYIDNIAKMQDDKLCSETYQMIYQSARCNNNPKADWHWMCDACWDESNKRGGNIYKKAYDACYTDHT